MTDVALSRQDAEAPGEGARPACTDVADVIARLRASADAEPPPMSAELRDRLTPTPAESTG